MIKVRLQIGNGKIYETSSRYGLVYVSSDNRFEAPLKEMEKTSYPEQVGENILNKTVRDAFDYNIEWFIDPLTASLVDANAVIGSFNSRLYTIDEQNVMTFYTVTFYNDYKRVKIVGTPSLIQEATEFWRDANGKQHDVVKVKWTIRVTDPSLCDFNLQ